MQIETIAVDRLIPYARNSRTHSDEQVTQISASIREFGFTNPVLIDADGGIIAGHGRVMGARALGMTEVPCIRLGHLTDAQKRAYVIADNKLALNAGWDDQMLALELRELADVGYDMGLTGFNTGDIDALIASLDATPEGQSDADAVPAVQEEVVTKPGDVWLLGKHRIMCGDSTSADNVQTLLGGVCRISWSLTRITESNTTLDGEKSSAEVIWRQERFSTTTEQTGVKHGRCFLGMSHMFGTPELGRTRSLTVWKCADSIFGRRSSGLKTSS